MEQSNLSIEVPSKLCVAPIAVQEISPMADSDQQQLPTGSSSHVPIIKSAKPKVSRGPRPRRKRQDPFGTLIKSTKKMRLNDGQGQGVETEGEGAVARSVGEQQQQQGAMELEKAGTNQVQDEMLMWDEEEDSDAYEDDSDSNAEDYYTNEYPDEEGGNKSLFAVGGVDDNEFENESTSDDNFDHYGDEQTKYGYYCESGDDLDSEDELFRLVGK